jgi:hypothetical protein
MKNKKYFDYFKINKYFCPALIILNGCEGGTENP